MKSIILGNTYNKDKGSITKIRFNEFAFIEVNFRTEYNIDIHILSVYAKNVI